MQVKIVCNNPDWLPKYQTSGSAGMDLHAAIDKPIVLKSLERALVPTGIFVELPEGFEAQIRPRGGLAFKHGITVTNSPGTMDSDYRGEYMVILQNLGKEDFVVEPGDRIAQLVIARYEQVDWQVVNELSDTKRAHGRMGSTGK